MHNQSMKESEGKFAAPKDAQCTCRKCKAPGVTYETWESSCGGFEDYKYTCQAQGCGYTWWVDGIDS